MTPSGAGSPKLKFDGEPSDGELSDGELSDGELSDGELSTSAPSKGKPSNDESSQSASDDAAERGGENQCRGTSAAVKTDAEQPTGPLTRSNRPMLSSLSPGEAVVIRSQRARDELAVFVGTERPDTSVAEAGVERRGINWMTQSLQIHRIMLPAETELAVRPKAKPGGEVFYPRILLKVGTLNTNAVVKAVRQAVTDCFCIA